MQQHEKKTKRRRRRRRKRTRDVDDGENEEITWKKCKEMRTRVPGVDRSREQRTNRHTHKVFESRCSCSRVSVQSCGYLSGSAFFVEMHEMISSIHRHFSLSSSSFSLHFRRYIVKWCVFQYILPSHALTRTLARCDRSFSNTDQCILCIATNISAE